MAEKKQQPTEEHILDLTRLNMAEQCRHLKRGDLTRLAKGRKVALRRASGIRKRLILVELAVIAEAKQRLHPNEPVRKPRPAQPPTPTVNPAPCFDGYDAWREQD